MDPRRRAITTLTARIGRWAEENRARLASLGEHLAGLKPAQVAGTELEAGFTRVRELQKELPIQRRRARSIVQLVERHRAAQEKLAENRRTAGELEKRNEDVCEEIGRAAFEAYKNIPAPGERFGALFAHLEELDRELQQGGARIEMLENKARAGALAVKIKIRSQIAYYKSLLALKKRTLTGSFRRTGKEICESEFVDRIRDQAFLAAIQPYMENRKRLLALAEQRAQLEARQEEIWSELKSLGAEKSHEKKVRELEKLIADAELRLKESCHSLGLQYRKNPVPALADNEDIKTLLQEISRAEKAMALDRKQIKRLEADLQAEELSRELEKTRAQIERLNEEISGRRREVTELEQRLREGEAERDRLLRQRGSESTLLEIEAPKQKGNNDG
jgi:chromosome segregation ATPase